MSAAVAMRSIGYRTGQRQRTRSLQSSTANGKLLSQPKATLCLCFKHFVIVKGCSSPKHAKCLQVGALWEIRRTRHNGTSGSQLCRLNPKGKPTISLITLTSCGAINPTGLGLFILLPPSQRERLFGRWAVEYSRFLLELIRSGYTTRRAMLWMKLHSYPNLSNATTPRSRSQGRS